MREKQLVESFFSTVFRLFGFSVFRFFCFLAFLVIVTDDKLSIFYSDIFVFYLKKINFFIKHRHIFFLVGGPLEKIVLYFLCKNLQKFIIIDDAYGSGHQLQVKFFFLFCFFHFTYFTDLISSYRC